MEAMQRQMQEYNCFWDKSSSTFGGQGKTGRKPASFHFRNEEDGGQHQWQYGVSGSGRMTPTNVREAAFTGADKTLDEAVMGSQV